MKIALITGASRGIGFEIARALYRENYFVIVSSSKFNEDTKKTFEKEFKDKYSYIYGDIKKISTWNKFETEIEKYGRIDMLINNAGIAPPERRDILETTEESFDLVINTNLRATFFLTQKISKQMIKFKNLNIYEYTPRIVNIGSMSAYTSSISRGEYCISKAGISMVTSLFADRLSEFNIPVFEIRPGIIKTDMTSTVIEKYDKLISDGITPTKRWGEPLDIAKIVASISNGNFDFSTGQIFNADGGFHLRRL